jgi:hypothetical protein
LCRYNKEDSIFVADMRRRLVGDEVLPALVRVMKGALDFPSAAEIFNRWVFTLSAKNCAVENERSTPTLTITVGARRGGDDDDTPSGGGGAGTRAAAAAARVRRMGPATPAKAEEGCVRRSGRKRAPASPRRWTP